MSNKQNLDEAIKQCRASDERLLNIEMSEEFKALLVRHILNAKEGEHSLVTSPFAYLYDRIEKLEKQLGQKNV